MQGCKCVHVNRMCAYTHALEQNERIVKRASILHLFFLFIFSCYLVLLFFFSSLFSFFLVAFHHLFVVVSFSYSSSFCIPYPYCRQGWWWRSGGARKASFGWTLWLWPESASYSTRTRCIVWPLSMSLQGFILLPPFCVGDGVCGMAVVAPFPVHLHRKVTSSLTCPPCADVSRIPLA